MSVRPLRADSSRFSAEQAELLDRLLPTLTPDQMVWLGGYLAGVRASSTAIEVAGPASATGAAQGPGAPSSTDSPETAVLYGSQTGNAKLLAEDLARRLQASRCRVTLSCMSEYKPNRLKKVQCLLLVVSTHGEGEPPDKAKLFYEFLHSSRAGKLEGLRYSVLALGDLSYEQFCQTGKDFDRRLEELGAVRLHPRVDCDLDFQESSEAWMQGVLAVLTDARSTRACSHDCGCQSSGGGAASRAGSCACNASAHLMSIGSGDTASPAGVPAHSRSRPFAAEVLENVNLNGRGSDKETRHLKLSLEGSGLEFEPGDSLGIYPQNHPQLVDEFIDQMGWRPGEAVPAGKEERTLREALLSHYEITLLTKPLLEQAAAFSRDGLADLVHRQPDDKLRSYLEGRDVLDLVRDFSLAGAPARDFLPLLRRMPPRLYSIASSFRANPGEVDLTVAAVRYLAHRRPRHGTCSVHCADRVQPGDALPVFVQPNPNFRLPRDPETPLIMVGPGTGVAPFRAFLEDREESGASGRSWLFFGDRRFRTDFLYQTDWLRWQKCGLLTRMDVAFSRETEQKVYVQHRMLQNSRELFAWLEEGAHFYVCGDANRMAADVQAALQQIVEREGAMSPEQAAAYVAALQQQGRYQRDVY